MATFLWLRIPFSGIQCLPKHKTHFPNVLEKKIQLKHHLHFKENVTWHIFVSSTKNKSINLQASTFPESRCKAWSEYIFPVTDPNKKMTLPKNRISHPHSNYLQGSNQHCALIYQGKSRSQYLFMSRMKLLRQTSSRAT